MASQAIICCASGGEINQVVSVWNASLSVRHANGILGSRQYFLAPTIDVGGAVYLIRFADDADFAAVRWRCKNTKN